MQQRIGNLFFKKSTCFLQNITSAVVFLGFCLTTELIEAEVYETTVSDVTTKAFSVVWVSDEAVTEANVRVYSDSAGLFEITPSIVVSSLDVPFAHDIGIVKIDVGGLDATTHYYFHTETSSASGTVTQPSDGSLIPVTTAVRVRRANDLDQPIVNDLIHYEAFGLNGVGALPGSVVFFSVPSISPYPISSFVGETGFPIGSTINDLNNLFDSSGLSAEIDEDDIILITEMRGLYCTDLVGQKMMRYAKMPGHDETPIISALEQAVGCFEADTICDRAVNVLDVQFVLNGFGYASGECGYNPQLDVISDNAINVLDVQKVLNHFDEVEPFE
ncbi:MAG: hypothetical protein KUG82_10350 [Pseudomonadales bacterium]|nr:hypothetical protein [Pseudomonadales bacterium]